MITQKDGTFDSILLVGTVLLCAVGNSKQLGSLRTGPRDLLGVGRKLILDRCVVSA